MSSKLLLLGISFFLCFNLSALEIILPQPARSSDLQARKLLERVLLPKCNLYCGNAKISKIHLTSTTSHHPLQEVYGIRQNQSDLILYGTGPRGIIYAVCTFLERSFGVRIWNSLEQYWPVPQTEYRLPVQKWEISPPFYWRAIHKNGGTQNDDGLFAAFNKINCYAELSSAEKYGGGVSFGRPYHVHTFNWYLPQKEFFSNHPEYFALINGKRQSGPRSQPCLSNPDVAKVIIEKLKKYILQDEADAAARHVTPPRIYDISQNDGTAICGCPQCQQIIKNEGGYKSGLFLHFVNKIAKEIEEFRPDIIISTLAYVHTIHPPKYIKPRHNVLIRLCNYTADHLSGISSQSNSCFRNHLRNWVERGTKNLYIWEYSVFYGMSDFPYPSEYYYPELFRYYRDHNIKWIFMEHEYPARGDMHTYKTYLEAKFMENPDTDFETISRDFLNGYYGKAGPYIRAYRDILYQSLLKTPSLVVLGYAGDFNYLNIKTTTEACRLLNQAEQIVRDSPTTLARVKQVRFNLDKTIYTLQRRWRLSQKTLPPELDCKSAFRRAEETWTNNIKKFYIPKHWTRQITALKQELEYYQKLPVSAGELNEFQDRRCIVDYLPDLLKRKDIIPDKSSSTGYTSKYSGLKSPEFIGGGFNVQKFTPQFARKFLSKAQIKYPGYHWYKLTDFTPEPGSYIYWFNWHFQVPEDTAAAYMTPGEIWELHIRAKFNGFGFNQQKNAVLIDRIVLVPQKQKK